MPRPPEKQELQGSDEMAFERLIGQKNVKDTLSELYLSGRVGHAYLFNGPSGIGKKSFAKEFAGLVMCPSATDGKRCGVCECCVLMDNSTNPDYKIIGCGEGKNTISVETIRNLRDDIVTAPIFGTKKIYVIDSAEKMTEQAQNALLKILEEPPPYAMIMLMCNNILSMLGTIRSRVIRVDFSRNTNDEIIEKYEQLCVLSYKKPDESKTELLCSYADGIMGRVEEFLDSDTLDEKRKAIFGCLAGVLRRDIDAKLKMTELVGSKGSNYEFILFTMMSFLRDVMIASRFGRKTSLQNPDFREEISVLGRDIGYYRAVKCLEIVDDCYKKLRRNAAPDITVDCMLIQLRES